MAKDGILDIPWSTIRPNAPAIIDHYITNYTGKVFFEFVAGKARAVGGLAVVTGAVTTVVGDRVHSCKYAELIIIL